MRLCKWNVLGWTVEDYVIFIISAFITWLPVYYTLSSNLKFGATLICIILTVLSFTVIHISSDRREE